MQLRLRKRLVSEDGILKVTNKPRARLLIIISILLLFAVAGGVYLSLQAQTKDLTNVNTVVSLVSRHMVLPGDETPALMTVTDPSKLTTAFLKGTKVGDKILIYQTNKRAIIYRPSIDRIVDIGPVVIDDVSTLAK